MLTDNKVYIKESIIPRIGNGLFAKQNINKGSIIGEFKGKLRKPCEKIISNHSLSIDEFRIITFDKISDEFEKSLIEIIEKFRTLSQDIEIIKKKERK